MLVKWLIPGTLSLDLNTLSDDLEVRSRNVTQSSRQKPEAPFGWSVRGGERGAV